MRLILLMLLAGLVAACDRKEEVAEESTVLVVARSAAERAFDERLAGIHEEWMGTAWTFSGVSQTPGEGSIACGYFVTTTLEQAGVKLDRIRLAQAASEKMILETTPSESVRRYSDASLEKFLAGVRKQGEGYYIVGLDNHTGFLFVSADEEVEFIHSGPGRGVVREVPSEALELASSRYRVTGKIVPTEPNAD